MADAAHAGAVRAVRGALVLADRVLDDGLVVVEGERIAWVGPADEVPPAWSEAAATPRRTAWVLPGLVDVHCHGGGGSGFPDADPAGCLAAVRHHRENGTTTQLASLVSAPADVLLERVALLADLAEAGEVAGIHLEGPFLAHGRCGAHDPAALQEPDAGLVERLVAAGRGSVRSMTLAPELPGAVEVMAVLRAHGVLPSLGHTDSTAAEFRAGVASAGPGPLSVTHLFNAMTPFDHRAPGAVPAALAAAARDEVVVELIADGVHLHADTFTAVFDLLGPERIALVSDAMAAAGMPDGRYPLGPLEVTVEHGVARTSTGSIAGSTSRLLDIVRCSHAAGVPLQDAVRSASATPAGLLGLGDEVGRLEPGLRADLLLLDAELAVTEVVRSGQQGISGWW